MAINLEKGGRIDLSKEKGLELIRIGLGWDTNKFDTGGDFDLDVSAFVCKNGADGNPKLISDEHFIFYNNPKTPDGTVLHSGDNRTGDGAGDDETIKVNLAKLDADEVSVVITIHKAVERKQNFGQVQKSYCKLYNDADGSEIAKYALEDDFSTETAVQIGSLYRKDGKWMFKAVGAGYKRGLEDFVKAYGGNV